MGTLKIERIGGVAGFGLPSSRVKSSGEQAVSALSADDQAKVEALFNNPEPHQKPGPERDAFRYRITRISQGKNQTVEVPETAIPDALKACVTDKLT
jgi:hypothetical protein